MTAREYKEKLLKQFTLHKSRLNGNGSHQFFHGAESAILAIEELDFPTKKHEEWKYTILDRVLGRDLEVISETKGVEEKWLETAHIEGLEAAKIVLLNGVLEHHDELPKGVEISSARKGDDVTPREAANDDIFENINQAFASDQLSISIAANAQVEQPLYIINVIDGRNDNVFAQRNLSIKVGRSAMVKVIENQISLGAHTTLSNGLSQISLDANAEMHHIVIQHDGENRSQVCRTYVSQNRDSRYSNYTYSLSGEIVRNNVVIELDEEHTQGNLYGLYLLDGKEHIDNHTLVDHKVPNCESNELYKGVLNGNAIGVFNGKVFVRQDAQKTNAYQQNRNLLLSDNATINTKPQLEIWADDVKCSHGCTVGQLDDEQLFYLKSRGLDGDTARSLMVYAFASEIVERVPIESVRIYLLNQIAQKLNFNLE